MSRKESMKNFLRNGIWSSGEEPEEEVVETTVEETVEETIEEPIVENVVEEEPTPVEEAPITVVEEPVQTMEATVDEETAAEEPEIPEPEPVDDTPGIEQIMIERTEVLEDTILSLRAQVEELHLTLKDLRERPIVPDMSEYVSTREQLKTITKVVENENAASTNKSLVHAMEQVATMREDFFKLCRGMENKIDSMSAKDVLSSFQAYEVDMENILTDAGVFIGHFDYTSLNTIHQRIIEVVPTDDPEKSGLIAERLSDGYKLGNRVLLKERVSVYKYAPNDAKEQPEETIAPAEELDTQPSEGTAAEEAPAEKPAEPHKTKKSSKTSSKTNSKKSRKN